MGVLNSNYSEISQMLPEKAKYFQPFKKHGFNSFLFVHLIGKIMDYLMVGVNRDMLGEIDKMRMKEVANEIFKN